MTNFIAEPTLEQSGIIIDYAIYSGMSVEEIVFRIHDSKRNTTPDYFTYGERFYSETKNYIFDILGGNPSTESRYNLINKFIADCAQMMAQHPGKFADFGGGVGAVCEIIKRMNPTKDVTYIDLDSHMMEFTKSRFKRHGLNINFVTIEVDDFELPENYDVIFTDAVWEHLKPEQQITYASKLAGYLNPGGMLVMLVDLAGESEDIPMHYSVDIVAVHDELERANMKCRGGRNNFASVWVK